MKIAKNAEKIASILAIVFFSSIPYSYTMEKVNKEVKALKKFFNPFNYNQDLSLYCVPKKLLDRKKSSANPPVTIKIAHPQRYPLNSTNEFIHRFQITATQNESRLGSASIYYDSPQQTYLLTNFYFNVNNAEKIIDAVLLFLRSSNSDLPHELRNINWKKAYFMLPSRLTVQFKAQQEIEYDQLVPMILSIKKIAWQHVTS